MTHRTTVSIDDSNYAFLNAVAGNNRSAYINDLLEKERKNSLRKAILSANQEEADDPEYQSDLEVWDETLGDGLAQNDI